MSPMLIPNDLECRELVELVTDYVEGALSSGERTRFEQHLVLCPDCTNYVDQMRATIVAVGALSEETIDPGAREELLRAFRHWRRGW